MTPAPNSSLQLAVAQPRLVVRAARARRFMLLLVGLLTLPLLSGIGATRGAHAQQTTRQQEQLLESLRREVTDQLLASGKISGVTVSDPRTLKAKSLAGTDLQIALDTALSEVNARPKDRREVVRRLVATAVATASAAAEPAPQTKDQFIASLRLLVRHVDYTRAANAAARPPNQPSALPIAKSLAGDAVVIVAIDRSESLLLALSGSGKAHGLEDDDLYALAKAETQKLKDDVTREAYGPLRFYGAREGSYSPSLLLVEGFWDDVERDLGPGFLVAIPDRTLLLAAPQRNASDLQRAVNTVVQQRKTTAHIPHFLQRANGTWIRHALP
jgi:hypothetical protein